jgi:hypothetical protein
VLIFLTVMMIVRTRRLGTVEVIQQ